MHFLVNTSTPYIKCNAVMINLHHIINIIIKRAIPLSAFLLPLVTVSYCADSSDSLLLLETLERVLPREMSAHQQDALLTFFDNHRETFPQNYDFRIYDNALDSRRTSRQSFEHFLLTIDNVAIHASNFPFSDFPDALQNTEQLRAFCIGEHVISRYPEAIDRLPARVRTSLEAEGSLGSVKAGYLFGLTQGWYRL